MSISGFQSISLFRDLSTSKTVSVVSGQNSFTAALAGLISAIQSGDVTTAKKYASEAQQLTPASVASGSPLGQFLSNASLALSSNNLSAAQEALSALSNEPSPDLSSTTSSATETTSSGGTSELAQDVVDLFSAVSAGDVSSAQSAYGKLTGLLVDTSSTDASTQSGTATSFPNLLQEIGSALKTGDMEQAQSALGGFLQGLSTGSLVSATA